MKDVQWKNKNKNWTKTRKGQTTAFLIMYTSIGQCTRTTAKTKSFWTKSFAVTSYKNKTKRIVLKNCTRELICTLKQMCKQSIKPCMWINNKNYKQIILWNYWYAMGYIILFSFSISPQFTSFMWDIYNLKITTLSINKRGKTKMIPLQ